MFPSLIPNFSSVTPRGTKQRRTHATRQFTAIVLSVDRQSDFHSVFGAKRLIGRKFSDPGVQSDVKHFPFKIIERNGRPYIEVQYRGEDKEFVNSIISQPSLIGILTLFLPVS